MFRIVSESRGDAVVGFRVQKHGWCARSQSEVWRNRGRRVFTVAHAQEMREFFEKQDTMMRPEPVYTEVVLPQRESDVFPTALPRKVR